MQRDSLEKAQIHVIKLLADPEINKIDRLELVKNILLFINVNKYDKNIKIMQKSLEEEKKKHI